MAAPQAAGQRRMLQVFLAETEENLARLETGLLELERDPNAGETLNTVFRMAHNLKGNATMLGLASIGSFAHLTEECLSRIRNGVLPFSSEVATLLLKAVDALRHLALSAAQGQEELQPAHREVLDQLAALQAGAEGAAVGPGPAKIEADQWRAPSPARDRLGLDVAARTTRVDAGKLDRMMDLIGEIGITQARLAREIRGYTDPVPVELAATADELERRHVELQEQILKVRMVPIGPFFLSFERVLRDTARASGKMVELRIEGAEVEADSDIINHIRAPITHIVRNAVDHGIELPGVRQQAGKHPVGTLTLRASHDAGCIVVEASDDGAGLNRDRIEAQARARNLLPRGPQFSEADLARLIFRPGFSTAPSVTETSGRGVGMDVVLRTLEAIRGTVAVDSAPGQGTTISLRLPPTLSIIQGLFVSLHNDTYILPLEHVIECIDFQGDAAGDCGILNLRGAALPYVRMAGLLGVTGAAAPSRQSVVVVQVGDRSVGFVVDDFLGQGAILVKPLGRLFRRIDGLNGWSVLTDGRVGLVLDLPRLLDRVFARAATAA